MGASFSFDPSGKSVVNVSCMDYINYVTIYTVVIQLKPH